MRDGDRRAIGVFDSGVGGLTVLRALRRRLPDEPTVYLGDTARVPYGTKSAATVVKYALNNARTLARLAELKLLVVACNTASAVSIPALQDDLSIPVLGVIEPGARAAMAQSRGGVIGVLGTAGTIRSDAYPKALRALGFTGEVVAIAAPLLVPLVEEGWTDGEVPGLVVDRYLAALPKTTDTVIMGCTHYPLLHDVLRARLAAHAALVDGAVATAEEVAALLDARGLRAGPSTTASHRLLVTDGPEQMGRLAPRFLGAAIDPATVELIDVDMTA